MFAPYTRIPTNILFFDRSGPTADVWYYELPLPEGRKQYTKTAPMQFEEFADCLAWWTKRAENERAWKVPAAELLANGCNLDRKNPNAKPDAEHLPPEQLVESILAKEAKIAAIVGEIKSATRRGRQMSFPLVPLAEGAHPLPGDTSTPQKTRRYPKLSGRGSLLSTPPDGANLKMKRAPVGDKPVK